jgi:hypothetical protein
LSGVWFSSAAGAMAGSLVVGCDAMRCNEI